MLSNFSIFWFPGTSHVSMKELFCYFLFCFFVHPGSGYLNVHPLFWSARGSSQFTTFLVGRLQVWIPAVLMRCLPCPRSGNKKHVKVRWYDFPLLLASVRREENRSLARSDWSRCWTEEGGCEKGGRGRRARVDRDRRCEGGGKETLTVSEPRCCLL